MKMAVICFTAHGAETASRIAKGEEDCQIWVKKKQPDQAENAAAMPETERSSRKAVPLTGSLKEWTCQRFKDSDALIFVGATGIAVRSIAPFLRSKKTDPAVLVVDERGTFVISLISGHIGGANELAEKVAEKIGAIPVVTTATDRNGLWAVDVFARKNGLAISDMNLAKYVSAALLDGKKVYFDSEFPIQGACPPELTELSGPVGSSAGSESPADASDMSRCLTVWVGIHTHPEKETDYRHAPLPRETISPREMTPADRNILNLAVPAVTLGIGCRKGKEPAEMLRFVNDFLKEYDIHPLAIEQICSIDVKKDEAGIIAVAQKMHVPFKTFSAQQLRECPGDFTPSAFVAQTVGVDNVCERSALLGARTAQEAGRTGNLIKEDAAGGSDEGSPRLIVRKWARSGMTAAAAVRPWRGTF